MEQLHPCSAESFDRGSRATVTGPEIGKRHVEASSLDDSTAPAKVWARHLGPLLRVWLHWKRGSLDQDGPEAVAHLSLGGGHWNVAVGDLSVLSQGASPGSDLKEEWKKLQQLSGFGASMARALCRLTGPFVVREV